MNNTQFEGVRKSRHGTRFMAMGLGAFSLFWGATGTQAEIILQSNPSFNVASTPLGGTTPGNHRQLAVGIDTGSTDWIFDSMVAQIRNQDSVQTIVGGIYSDVSGSPGTLYASFVSVDVAPQLLSSTVTFLTDSPITLLANTTYWFLLDDATGNEADWMIPDPNVAPIATAPVTYVGTSLSANSGATWSPSGNNTDISVNATAVPEPSVWMLLGLGALALGLTARRRSPVSPTA